MVLTAKSRPEQMLVPPLADRLLMYYVKETIFYGVTHLSPHTLSPQFSKVMMESRSAGVKASRRYFMVLLTSSIFYPIIEPLTSITHMRSTLVLVPPSVFRETIAGNITFSLSLAIDLWALMSIYIFASFFSYFTLSIIASSSLKTSGCLIGL